MEALLSSASDSPEDNYNNRNHGLLPAFATTFSLRNEIPESLLQDDASTLNPSESEQDALTSHNSSRESAYWSGEELPLQQGPCREQVTVPRHQKTQDQPEDVLESSTTLFQEWSNAETGLDARRPLHKPYSWKEKLGTFAIVFLIAGSLLLCAAVGTLAFIWFGSPAIPAWKEITARNWLSKAISICIGVIQQVMMLQLGIVTATLASLALESGDIRIGDVASVSAMRASATSTGAFVMAWQYLSGASYRSARHSSNIFLILSAALLWCLSQFLLLIILTDVSLRSTAGLASSSSLPYSLHYNSTGTKEGGGVINTRFQRPSVGAWNRKISKYASFAEYSEPPYEADGVSDTGVTLRAFLPFGTAQDRENLETYKGNLTVLDARVTCQVPQIKNATVDSNRRVRGSLAATRNTPQLANALLDKGKNVNLNGPANTGVHPDGTKDFDCIMATKYDDPTSSQWGLSLCQLWKGEFTERMESFGGLYSEFQNSSLMGGTDLQGSAYLLLNNSLGIFDAFWDAVSPPRLTVVAEASQERGEWLDLLYSNGSVMFSATICYAAFDFADIDVSISSQSNRTESRLEPVFDKDKSTYTFQELRYAMGQDRSLGMERRGMLELAKGAWQVAPNEEYPDSQTYPGPQPYSGLQSYSALDLRMTADLAYTKSILTRFENTDDSMATGTIRQLDYCDAQNVACVVPEDMHVSAFLGYRLLPHQGCFICELKVPWWDADREMWHIP